MKKAFKKLIAVAMAFTLLGTGTTLAKTIAPQKDNTIVASATTCNNCHGGSYYVVTDDSGWVTYNEDCVCVTGVSGGYGLFTNRLRIYWVKHEYQRRVIKTYCNLCKKVLHYEEQYRTNNVAL
ncbi:MAG: hypothetical protein IKH78_01635 [Ruminococcus sp.]|nr:hypothetical protein [Ruminococcus sp.]